MSFISAISTRKRVTSCRPGRSILSDSAT
jgi:hypothetical protein